MGFYSNPHFTKGGAKYLILKINFYQLFLSTPVPLVKVEFE